MSSSYRSINHSFYQNQDVVAVARTLIGKVLVTNFKGTLTSGRIVETEAYSGLNDKACHANKGATPRTKIMFQEGGKGYVYLCYGIHHLFNVVTNLTGNADAVLIRAIEPLDGIDVMMCRRKKNKLDSNLTRGPGSMAKALGINLNHYGMDLTAAKELWIQEKVTKQPPQVIKCSARIGVGYAMEDAMLPWRFYEANNKWVSKGKIDYADVKD